MKIAIRGASGFIGSNLAKKIISQKDYEKLILITRNKNKRELGELVENHKGVRIVQCHNLDSDCLKKAVADCDLIYDLSGLAYHLNSRDSLKDQITNNSLSAFVLGSAIRADQRLIWTSTCAVHSYLKTSYAFSKMLGEEFLRGLSQGNIKILRISDVYGPGQDISAKIINPKIPARRIQRFVCAYKLIRDGQTDWIPQKDKKLHGFYKEQDSIVQEIKNDFVYPTFIEDIVDILLKAKNLKTKETVYELWGNRISNYKVVTIIQNYFRTKVILKVKGKRLYPKYLKERDFLKLGINPSRLTSFEEGLPSLLK